jgi:cobalt-zinc-cadmium resistance protein CzcA
MPRSEWPTGTNFSISAAVGFVSLFAVAIMDGPLLISYFNALRAKGLPLHEAIMEGASKRVRPVMMTALTAMLGLLPAALSTRIGAQTRHRGGGRLFTTLFLTRYLMPCCTPFTGAANQAPPHYSVTLRRAAGRLRPGVLRAAIGGALFILS